MNKLILIIFLGLFSSCDGVFNKEESHNKHEHSKVKSYYTCSMHPQVKEEKSGKCPICHMSLTKVEVDEAEDINSEVKVNVEDDGLWRCEKYPEVTSEVELVCPLDGTPMVKNSPEKKAGIIIGKVKLRKSQLKHFTPDHFPATSMKMKKNIRLLGTVLQSEDKESNIPARIGGRVEKVFIKSTGSLIKVNDPVINIYSPKLITGGEEYLIARRTFERTKTKEFKELYNQSIERLRLWGIKKFQYETWYKRGNVPQSITLYSANTGIVRKRNAVVGKYFKEGQNFFELSDLSDVWVEMDVYEHDSNLVQLGQKIKLSFTAIPGQEIEGEIDFVDPVLNSTSRTLKVRATIANINGKLKPGMVADAILKVEIEVMPLVIPRTAIIDTGKRKVVWSQVSGKQFQAKTILTGYESEGFVEVKSGLMEGEKVVIDGNFLLDAQAQLFGGYE